MCRTSARLMHNFTRRALDAARSGDRDAPECQSAPLGMTAQYTPRRTVSSPRRGRSGVFVFLPTLPPSRHSRKWPGLSVLGAIVMLANLLALPPVASVASSTSAPCALSRMPPPGDDRRMLRPARLSSTGLHMLRGGGNEDRDQLKGELPYLLRRPPAVPVCACASCRVAGI